jgi:hypothetical protein
MAAASRIIVKPLARIEQAILASLTGNALKESSFGRHDSGRDSRERTTQRDYERKLKVWRREVGL